MLNLTKTVGSWTCMYVCFIYHDRQRAFKHTYMFKSLLKHDSWASSRVCAWACRFHFPWQAEGFETYIHTCMLKAALRSFSDLSNANLRVYLWAKTSQAEELWTIHTRSHLDFIKKHESVCMFVYVYVWDKSTYTRGYLRHANIHAELSETCQHTRLAIWDIQRYTLCCLRHTNANALLPETYKYTRLATWDVQTYTPSYLRHTNTHA